MLRRCCFVLGLSLLCLRLPALVPVQPPVYSENTGIAPAFFGPNAFPVPDMLDGRTCSTLRFETAGDAFWGYENDWTADLSARINIPLWTPRVNLSVWMPAVVEWYWMTTERQHTCRIQDSIPISGHEAGDVHFSIDIHLLREARIAPDIAFRAGCKTASGGSYDKARYYDTPGYWFDAAIGKSMYIGRGGKVTTAHDENTLVELRLAGSAGFLCWQTDNGRQNDAVMYGVQLLAKAEYVSLRATWGGYVGWEEYGDQPMTLKVQVSGHAKGFEPFLEYQYGIKDYPFHQFRVGLAYNIDILSFKKKDAQQ